VLSGVLAQLAAAAAAEALWQAAELAAVVGQLEGLQAAEAEAAVITLGGLTAVDPPATSRFGAAVPQLQRPTAC
jgi:hypothetical protein